MHGTVVLLPGDPLFTNFLLGEGDVQINVFSIFGYNGFTPCFFEAPDGVCTAKVPNPDPSVLLITKLTATFSETFRYCAPGVDLGCPDAIPGFNAIVPNAGSAALLGSGLLTLGAIARHRPRRARDSQHEEVAR